MLRTYLSVMLTLFSSLLVTNLVACEGHTRVATLDGAKPQQPTLEIKTEAKAEVKEVVEVKKEVAEAKEAAPVPEKIIAQEITQTIEGTPELQVIDFVLTSKMESREPTDALEAFTKDHSTAYAFARVSATESTDVTFVWYRNGQEQTRFKSPVHAAKRWRTFSSVKLKPGEWKVQLISKDKVLSEKTFTIS